MIFARSASGMCLASSIVIDTTPRSGDGSSRKRITTADRPLSGVNVMNAMPPVATVRVSPSE